MGVDHINAKKAYFDTNVFIYLFEEHPQYQTSVIQIIERLESIDCQIITSELTLAECLIKPCADNDIFSQERYIEALQTSDFLTVVPVSKDVLIEASHLRASYRNKLPDAIHLATALTQGCDLFVGNDKGITTPEGLELFLLF